MALCQEDCEVSSLDLWNPDKPSCPLPNSGLCTFLGEPCITWLMGSRCYVCRKDWFNLEDCSFDHTTQAMIKKSSVVSQYHIKMRGSIADSFWLISTSLIEQPSITNNASVKWSNGYFSVSGMYLLHVCLSINWWIYCLTNQYLRFLTTVFIFLLCTYLLSKFLTGFLCQSSIKLLIHWLDIYR